MLGMPETAETVALNGVQDEYEAILSLYHAEERELLAKYDKLYAPIFAKRRDIVNGLVSVPPLESKVVEVVEGEVTPTGIPDFWLTCLRNCNLDQIIEEADEGLLSHLTDITTATITGDAPGFSLSFHFSKNDFMSNDVLTITLTIPDFPGGDEPDSIVSWCTLRHLSLLNLCIWKTSSTSQNYTSSCNL